MRLTAAAARALFPNLNLSAVKRRQRALSRAEEQFALHCRLNDLHPLREHRFAASIGRRWRFDFAWPELKVAVEIEGLSIRYIDGVAYALGRHTTPAGFAEDCRKYAEASILGWQVLRFCQRLVKDGTAIGMTKELLHTRGGRPCATPNHWSSAAAAAGAGK